ncbi:MAG: tyrosine-type recombinase/integrase [Candidatus Tectomicrobia bacterium]
MLTTYFEAPFTLTWLRSSPSGLYLDEFARILHTASYSDWTARKFLRAAAHLGCWLQVSGNALENVSLSVLTSFRQHLPSCGCPQVYGGKGADAEVGARRFVDYLREAGVVTSTDTQHESSAPPPLVAAFLHWMQQHRGATASTLSSYGRIACDLLQTLGGDPSQCTAVNLRTFIFDRASRYGRGTANNLVTASRMFIRYLTSEGHCPGGLHAAIPTLAHWRLSTLPRYLPAADVERIIATCDAHTPLGTRDRAIVLLLARLGLRAGEVASLRLPDIDWQTASVRIAGKGRREACLPLSQEVGDALLAYLAWRPARHDIDMFFLRFRAPLQHPLSSAAISAIVARAIQRARVTVPSHGAHVLRHSAATAMLRQGVPLEAIQTILRHRSIETTVHYAKVDLALLRQVAQPWPEGSLC